MKQEEIKIGTPVIYWGVIKENGQRFDPFLSKINSDIFDVCGEIVCKIEGKRGGVSIKHLDLITAGSLMAAKLQGLKDISNQQIENATKKIFNDNGVNIFFSR